MIKRRCGLVAIVPAIMSGSRGEGPETEAGIFPDLRSVGNLSLADRPVCYELVGR